jgi:hypothetical protein
MCAAFFRRHPFYSQEIAAVIDSKTDMLFYLIYFSLLFYEQQLMRVLD